MQRALENEVCDTLDGCSGWYGDVCFFLSQSLLLLVEQF